MRTMPSTDDGISSPLDLVVRTCRRRSEDGLSLTLLDDSASPLSASPDSSPACDTGIETGSDVSSMCGDAAYSSRGTTSASQYCYELGAHQGVKPEPDPAYHPACEQTVQVREAARTMTPVYQPSTVVVAPSNFQRGVTVPYTYEAFIATDGRSRRRKTCELLLQGERGTAEHFCDGATTTTTTTTVTRRPSGRYTCCECGRHYATSSNLSRHKQTHRSLDSRYARACPHCHKPYVSMPALAMHILTHDLKSVTAVFLSLLLVVEIGDRDAPQAVAVISCVT